MKMWQSQSLDSEEYVRKTMPHTIGTFEMAMIVMLYMFTVTNPVSTIGAGAASITYWIIGGAVFFVPTVIAAVQLASMFPHEGSTYIWTHKALGGFWSFFATVTFWLPGMLVSIGFAGTATSLIQGLNKNWLTLPWQQGLLAIGLQVIATVLSLQRFRILLHIVNITTIVTYSIVFLLGLAGVVWLLTGHPSAAGFTTQSWGVNSGNFGLFGAVVIAYLGIDAPFILGGERKQRFSASRALLWSSIAILAAYLVISFTLLVVEGPASIAQLGNFSVIAIIGKIFGPVMADIVTIGVLLYFPVFLALNGSIFGRLLMTTSIDRRLPIGLAKLNRNRVPGNAIIFQAVVIIVFAAIAFLFPYIIPIINPADLNSEVLTITLSMMTLIWSVSSAFLFVDMLIFYVRDPKGFVRQSVFPRIVIWLCILVAPIACVIAIIMTLIYSPLPQLSTDQWRFIVGGLTIICLGLCAIVSLYATSEAAWQDQIREADESA